MSRQVSLSDSAIMKLDSVRVGVESYSTIIDRIFPTAKQVGPMVIHGAFEDLRWLVHRYASTEMKDLLVDIEKVVIRDSTNAMYTREERDFIISSFDKTTLEIREFLNRNREKELEYEKVVKLQNTL